MVYLSHIIFFTLVADEIKHLRLSSFLRRQIMMQLLNRVDDQQQPNERSHREGSQVNDRRFEKLAKKYLDSTSENGMLVQQLLEREQTQWRRHRGG
jgi:hypothetical protein